MMNNINVTKIKLSLPKGQDLPLEVDSRNGNGPCLAEPGWVQLTQPKKPKEKPDYIWTCSMASDLTDEKELKKGNHVIFNIRDFATPKILKISAIQDDYCVPAQAACTCDALIDSLLIIDNELPDETLPLHKVVQKIHFKFDPTTCQCLLRRAESFKFKYAELIFSSPKGECAEKKLVKSTEFKSSPQFLCEGGMVDGVQVRGFFQKCKAIQIQLSKA